MSTYYQTQIPYIRSYLRDCTAQLPYLSKIHAVEMFKTKFDAEAALEDAKLTILEQVQFLIFFVPSQTCQDRGRQISKFCFGKFSSNLLKPKCYLCFYRTFFLFVLSTRLLSIHRSMWSYVWRDHNGGRDHKFYWGKIFFTR